MAITNRTSFQETNSLQLVQSADSLESALAQFSKLAASIEHSVPAAVQSNAGRGFDEWIASDLQYGALLGGDETALSASPYSVSVESPLLEQELLSSNATSSLFEFSDASQAFSFESQASPAQDTSLDSIDRISSLGLSTSKLQRAAAALNIPWSQELERSVIRQTQKLSGVVSGSGIQSAPQQSISSVSSVENVSKRPYSQSEEESEEIIAKRAKNTDAARRSRLKKLVKLEGLEAKVTDLEATNHRLNTRVAVLETEKNGFLIKEAERNARIAQLEAKIMEAHLTLKTRLP
ncbi:hypothetical protein BGX21_008331 [Mortierella sp. AD011]|nr:hypothetical protein BGX20_000798 [Mortierella sp. AD010]KAF9397940.1 hypothetical protein BGX21_008331 [Mortierella sp. AD011]